MSLQNLIQISHLVGRKPELIQGGGGNTSAKISPNEMLIKSSGFLLSEMDEEKGYAVLNPQNILAEQEKITLKNNLEIENQLSHYLTEIAKNGKPSMETSMHAALNKYVVHTHPVHLNVFSCLVGGEAILRKILPEFIWIPYVNPGYNLGLEIMKIAEPKKSQIIILQNHGLIASSENAHEAAALNIHLNEIAKNHLQSEYGIENNFTTNHLEEFGEKISFSNHPLILEAAKDITKLEEKLKKAFFPDFVVYGLRNCSYGQTTNELEEISNIPKEQKGHMRFLPNKGVLYYGSTARKIAMHQTLLAVLFIMQAIEKIGRANYISNENALYIANMDSEKYREQLISQ